MFGSAGSVGGGRTSPHVVLGIDPGVSRCGYGAVVAEGSSLSAVACGVIRTPPGDPLPDRLAALLVELEALLVEFRPSAVAVERVFFQVNARTAMSVGQASGLALVAVAQLLAALNKLVAWSSPSTAGASRARRPTS